MPRYSLEWEGVATSGLTTPGGYTRLVDITQNQCDLGNVTGPGETPSERVIDFQEDYVSGDATASAAPSGQEEHSESVVKTELDDKEDKELKAQRLQEILGKCFEVFLQFFRLFFIV